MTRRTEALKHKEKEIPRRKRTRDEGTSSHPPPPLLPSPAPSSPPGQGLALPELVVHSLAHRARMEYLEDREFEHSSYIDWDVLALFGLEGQVRDLISIGAWEQFFTIREPTFRELTLEFMATFTLERNHLSWGLSDTIQFRMCGTMYRMSYTQFSIYMGLYTPEFVASPDYEALKVSLPSGMSERVAWGHMSDEGMYDCGRSKASRLRQPAWRYVHAILARTISGRGRSQGVVGTQDVYYLHSMIFRYSIHIGHALAHYMFHQSADRRVASICIGPYVTRLARNMGILPPADEMTKVQEMVPLTRATLRAMGFRERGAVPPPVPPPALVPDPPQPAPPPPPHTPPAPILSERIDQLRDMFLEFRKEQQVIVSEQRVIVSTLARICEHLHLPPPHGTSTLPTRPATHDHEAGTSGGAGVEDSTQPNGAQ